MQKERARRQVLLSTLVAGSAITAKSLPSQWTKPIVNSVMLPAHAVSSPTLGNFNVIACPVENPTVTVVPNPNELPCGAGQITSGGGVLNIVVNNVYTTTEIVDTATKVTVGGDQFCTSDTLSASEIESFLKQMGFSIASVSVVGTSTQRLNMGQTIATNTDLNITQENGTVSIGSADTPSDACAIQVLTGQVNLTATNTITTTQRFTEVLCFEVSV
ncbi:MAG: hypothetical protein AAF402_13035 [Pseudomonadota bacterium]